MGVANALQMRSKCVLLLPNGTLMERYRNAKGTLMERIWNAIGMHLERYWNANGTLLER